MSSPADLDTVAPVPDAWGPVGTGGGPSSARESVDALHDPIRLMIEAVRDYAIFMLDVGGRVRTWNAGAERLKGYRAEEIVGQHFSIFYPEEDRKRGHPEAELRRALAEGRYEEEGWRIRRDGSRFWANVVITPFFDPNRGHIGFTKVTRDFTDRRHTAELLRQSEERLRMLVESVKDYAIYMLDPSGVITTWNSGAQAIKGYRSDEILGRHFSVFYPPEDVAAGRPERELDLALSQGRYEEEAWRVRKNGERFWASVVISAVHDATGHHRGFAKVTRDLTERRQAQSEAMAAKVREIEAWARAVEAQGAVQLRDEFISVAAHELRTPLTALQLKLQGLDRALSQGDRGPLDARVTSRLEGASRQVQRLTRLIEELLDVSRIVGGRLTLATDRIDLGALTAAVVDDLAEPARRTGSEIRFRGSEVVGQWDLGRLEQALLNVVSNAVKYGEGKPIDVAVEAVPGGALVTVTDRGVGIAAEDLERIFSRFVRAAPSRHYGGLGLGLYLARSIVEAHGGKIRVQSSPGHGSTFTIELPLAVPASESRSQPAP